jgi:hypothetical protein
MSITSSCAPTLRRIYVDFLSSLPPSPSDRADPECMKRALARLAELATDPSIASRTLKSPMTFSLVPSCARQLTGLSVLMHNGATNTGFSAFPPDYRSERKCVRSGFCFSLNIGQPFSHAQRQVLRTHQGALSSKERFTSTCPR